MVEMNESLVKLKKSAKALYDKSLSSDQKSICNDVIEMTSLIQSYNKILDTSKVIDKNVREYSKKIRDLQIIYDPIATSSFEEIISNESHLRNLGIHIEDETKLLIQRQIQYDLLFLQHGLSYDQIERTKKWKHYEKLIKDKITEIGKNIESLKDGKDKLIDNIVNNKMSLAKLELKIDEKLYKVATDYDNLALREEDIGLIKTKKYNLNKNEDKDLLKFVSKYGTGLSISVISTLVNHLITEWQNLKKA